MKIITIHRISLQFDGNDSSAHAQGDQMVGVINEILIAHGGMCGQAALFAAPDEIEVEVERRPE